MLKFLMLFYGSSKLSWLGLLLSSLQGIHMPSMWLKSCNFFTRCRGIFTTSPGIPICVPWRCFCLTIVLATNHSWCQNSMMTACISKRMWHGKESIFLFTTTSFLRVSRQCCLWSKLLQNIFSIVFSYNHF